MPIDMELVSQPLYNPTGAETPPPIQGPPAPGPTFGQQLTAQFRQNNIISSYMANQISDTPSVAEEGFNLWDDYLKGTPQENNWRRFVDAGAFNRTRAMAVSRQIEMETDDKRTIATMPWYTAIPTAIAAGVLDPTVLLPAGGAVKSAQGGFSVLRSALMTGGAVGAQIALQESVLQSTQVTRPLSESAENIGIGIIFGAVLGGGMASLLSKADAAISARAAEVAYGGEVRPLTEVGNDLAAPSAMNNPAALGADALQGLPPEATQIRGTWVDSAAGSMGWMVPNLRATQWTSPYAREVAQSLMENSLGMVGHAHGMTAAPGGAASREAKILEAMSIRAAEETNGIYDDMWKAGVQMPKTDFAEAVGWALSNGNKALDGNEFVTKAAEVYRTKFFDKLLAQGEELGLFQKGTAVNTAESYFPRQPIRNSFVENQGVWMDRNIPYWEEQLTKTYTNQLDAVRAQTARIEQVIQDMKLPAERAAKLHEQLGGQIKALEAANPEILAWKELKSDLRNAIREAPEFNTTTMRDGVPVLSTEPTKAQLRAELKAMEATEGPEVKAFTEQRNILRERRRAISQGEAAQQARATQIANQLADIEEASVNSLERLINRGRQTERKMAKLDPEDAAAEVVRLRENYEAVIRRDDKALRRRMDAIERIETQAGKKLEQAAKDAERAKSGQVEDATAKTGKTPDELRIEAERDMAIAKQMKIEADMAARRLDEIRHAADRLEAAQAFDPLAAQQLVREANDAVVRNVSMRQLTLGERAQKLKDRLAARTPEDVAADVARQEARRDTLTKVFEDKWERKALSEGVDAGGVNAPNFRDFARQISEDAFNKYAGRNFGDGAPKQPDYITTVTRGPFKGRTYNVPDFVLDPPRDPVQFFHRNVFEVSHIHGRQMAGDIAIARRHGNPQMEDVFGRSAEGELGASRGKIGEDYDRLRKEVIEAATPEDALAALGKDPIVRERIAVWRGKDTREVTEKRLLRLLDEEERGVREDLGTMRDSIRSTYLADVSATDYARAVRVTASFNFLRVMGGLGISMLTDLYRPAMVRGISSWVQDGLAPFIARNRGFEILKEEAKDAYLILNKTSQQILTSMAELGDPMARGTPLERFMDRSTSAASVWNGSRILQDSMESIGANMTQTHIIRTISTAEGRANNVAYLTKLGITPDIAEAMAAKIAQHGETVDGIRVPNTNKWGDERLVSAYRAAVGKEVDGMFSTRNAGDVPWFMQTPTGQLLLQFNSFNIASFSKVLLSGMQENKARFAQSVLAMTSLGMVVAYLQAAAGGKERLEKFQQSISDNPLFLVAEGLDKSGIFAVPFWGANAMESASAAAGFGRINPIKTPMMAMAGEQPRANQSVAAGRDIVTALGGPTLGMISNIPRAAGAAVTLGQGDSPKRQQSQALQQMIPGGTYPGMRQFLQLLSGDLPGR